MLFLQAMISSPFSSSYFRRKWRHDSKLTGSRSTPQDTKTTMVPATEGSSMFTKSNLQPLCTGSTGIPSFKWQGDARIRLLTASLIPSVTRPFWRTNCTLTMTSWSGRDSYFFVLIVSISHLAQFGIKATIGLISDSNFPFLWVIRIPILPELGRSISNGLLVRVGLLLLLCVNRAGIASQQNFSFEVPVSF